MKFKKIELTESYQIIIDKILGDQKEKSREPR